MGSERTLEKPDPGLVWNDESERFYLDTAALGPRLDLLKHLIEESRLPIFVIAERGSGKSALLDEVLTMARDGWRVARIQANAMLAPLTLLRDLTQALTPGVRGQDRNALLAALEDLLAASSDTRFIPVVLVDDAHELSEEALKLLFSLGRASPSAPHFRIVLFCEPQIEPVLKARGLASVCPPVTQVLDLPPFTIEDTRAYLAERLSRVGLGTLLPLAAGIAERIHQDARGLPGAIDAVARETLWRGEGKPEPAPEADKSGPWAALRHQGWRLYTAALVLAVVTGLIVMGSGTEDAGPAPASGVVPLEIPPPEAEEVVVPPALEPPADALPPLAEEAPPATPKPRPDSAPVEPPAEPRPAAAPPQPRAAPTAAPEVKSGQAAGADWLRAQPAGAYVLQLFGSLKRDAVKAFLDRQGFGGRATWLTTKRNGEDWHIVVYGPFPDRAAAHAAIGSLPPAVRALRPWARRISDVTTAGSPKR